MSALAIVLMIYTTACMTRAGRLMSTGHAPAIVDSFFGCVMSLLAIPCIILPSILLWVSHGWLVGVSMFFVVFFSTDFLSDCLKGPFQFHFMAGCSVFPVAYWIACSAL